MGILDELDAVSLDWDAFEDAGGASRDLLARLVDDRAALRQLVGSIEDSPHLLAMCETHDASHKLVLHDALDRGFRLRMHIKTDANVAAGPRLMHDHLFSFSAAIVHGEYLHALYELPSLLATGPFDGGLNEHFRAHFLARQQPGSTYSLHHSTPHEVIARGGTVSLFLRGPKVDKPRTMLVEHGGKTWVHDGGQPLGPGFDRFRPMTRDEFGSVRRYLLELR